MRISWSSLIWRELVDDAVDGGQFGAVSELFEEVLEGFVTFEGEGFGLEGEGRGVEFFELDGDFVEDGLFSHDGVDPGGFAGDLFFVTGVADEGYVVFGEDDEGVVAFEAGEPGDVDEAGDEECGESGGLHGGANLFDTRGEIGLGRAGGDGRFGGHAAPAEVDEGGSIRQAPGPRKRGAGDGVRGSWFVARGSRFWVWGEGVCRVAK